MAYAGYPKVADGDFESLWGILYSWHLLLICFCFVCTTVVCATSARQIIARRVRATAATRGNAQFELEIGERNGSGRDTFAYLTLGNGIANTNIHANNYHKDARKSQARLGVMMWKISAVASLPQRDARLSQCGIHDHHQHESQHQTGCGVGFVPFTV